VRRRRVSKVLFLRSMSRTRGGHVRLYYAYKCGMVVSNGIYACFRM
jgi:hypothetical protein